VAFIRALNDGDVTAWAGLRSRLWPDADAQELAQEAAAFRMSDAAAVFIAEDEGRIAGFLELSLRSYAEGCASSPVPYVEGWYVEPDRRRQGIGAALMRAAEDWSRSRGYEELGSDTEWTNRLSRDAHAALGFTEVETITVFRKSLRPRDVSET
jgi:aminoglycoside 6'-N-acetyltransferase I